LLKNKKHISIIFYCVFIISFSAAAESADNGNAISSIITEQLTYNVSGYVLDINGIGLGGVLVQNDTKSVTTLASGDYSIAGLPNGTYNLSYTKDGFDPGYLVVTVKDADNINVNKTIFDTTPPGQVTGLRNDSPTRTNINLSWDTLIDANYFLVYRNSKNLGYTKNAYWNDTNLTSDTVYLYEVRANDSYNNWGQNSSILIVRTAPPLDTSPPTIKINNDAKYTNSTAVILDLTSTMGWMSLRNEDINWTDWMPFTSTKSWTLTPYDGTKRVFLKVRNDDFSDPTQFVGDEIILDATKPTVTNSVVYYQSTQLLLNEPVNIMANVYDRYLNFSSTIALVDSPNGNTSECKLIDKGIFICNFKDTYWYGRYDVRILASDLAGNINNTEKTWFVTTIIYENKTVNTIANNTTEIDALKEVNTTLDLVTSENLNKESITITMSSDIPPEMNRSMGLSPFGKYISIENPGNNVANRLNWMKVKIYYTEKELSTSRLDENSLRISYYNESSKRWELLSKGSQSWVYDAGVNAANTNNYSGFVWANVSHLSTFALVGSYPVSSTPPTSSSSGGGGGGGGGGTSGENFSNIILKERYDKFIYKDIVTSYKFSNINNPILSIDIVGNVNAGEIVTAVEVLKNTSSLVVSPASGNVYRNVNMWVGTSGFGTSKNIKQAVITFRIENSWFSSNNMKSGSIKMLRWNGSKWNPLETSEKSKDSNYSYFEAKTDRFSSFVITGIDNKEYITENSNIKEPTKPAATIQPDEEKPNFITNWFIIIGVLFAIGLIIEMYQRMKKK